MNKTSIRLKNKYEIVVLESDKTHSKLYLLKDYLLDKVIVESFNKDSFLLKIDRITRLSKKEKKLIERLK